MSYVELLIQLRKDVESDIMPASDKAKVILLIEKLEELLWKYSA